MKAKRESRKIRLPKKWNLEMKAKRKKKIRLIGSPKPPLPRPS